MNTITMPAREGWPSYVIDHENAVKSSIAEYLAWKASYTKAAHKTYRVWIERFHEHIKKPVEHVTLSDFTSFLSSLSNLHAEKNIWYAMTVVRNYLRYFKEQGRVNMPVSLARVPNAFANSHYSIREDEYQRMIETLHAKHPEAIRDRLIIRLLHDTGLRVGELCSLDLDDMHDDQSATVRTEKTIRSRRVFWNPDTEQNLQNYFVERLKESTELDALFVSPVAPHYKRLTPRSVQRIVRQAAKEAGIANNVTPHSFRHAFVHRVAKLGIPDAIIAVLVGHRSPHTIAHYTKLSRTEYEDAFRRSFVNCESPFNQLLKVA